MTKSTTGTAIVAMGLVITCVSSGETGETVATGDMANTPIPAMGFARAPEGTFAIERVPAPLFRDPVFDGAADPSVVYDESDGSWLIYCTQRRANVPGPGVAWCFGTDIGIARSTNQGRSWSYAGKARNVFPCSEATHAVPQAAL